jgi:hypothetical protein
MPPVDDLDAIKTIIQTLEPFETKDRERIIRWACEKLGIIQQTVIQASPQKEVIIESRGIQTHQHGTHHGQAKDIKTFLTEKNPKSNNQLAAAVAYYHMFEAPDGQKKNSITKEDLQSACRLGGLQRLTRPEMTLVNAHHVGLLDKGAENGAYTINSVGENLVAMTMPSDSGVSKPKKPKKTAKKAAKKKS